jgi:outer membrane receptor protein involved in Fe transport
MNNENQILRRAVRLAVGAAVVAPIVATQSPQAVAAVTGEFEVLGTHIPRTTLEGPSPVIVIDRAQLDKSGFNTVADILERLPINSGTTLDEGFTNSFAPGTSSLDLRGLGRTATLVLLNGRRVANYGFAQNITETFVDLNSIPLAAVEQIQILKDGASAIYGADAVAGVVNIILRRNYEGAEMALSYGDTQDGGGAETAFSFVSGKSFGKTNATFVFDYFKRDPLYLSERDFSRSANHDKDAVYPGMIPTSTPDGFQFSSFFGNPGTAFTSAGFVPDPACGLVQPPSTFGPTGDSGSQGEIRPNEPGFGICRYDYAVHISASPETERYGFYGQLEHEFTPNLKGWMELGYQDNNSFQEAAPTPVVGGVATGTHTVPASNPSNPFGEDVYLFYRLTDAGPRTNDVTSETTRFVGGLQGVVGQYDWEAAYLYTKNDNEDNQGNYMSSARIQQALNDGSLLVFGGATNDPAVINSLYIDTFRLSESELQIWDGKISGPAWGWSLPGGPVNFALGAEIRTEEAKDTPDSFTLNNDVEASGGTQSQGERDVFATYVEFQLPVTDRLELQLAGRYESTETASELFPDSKGDFSSTDPKLALRYQVNDQVVFRGSYSTAFRAPSLAESFLGNSVSFQNLTDTERCNITGLDQDCGGSQYQVTFGGNPDLVPEEADVYNFGLAFQPNDELSLVVDYWSYDHTGLITNDTQFTLTEFGRDQTRVQRKAPTAAEVALFGPDIPGDVTNINDSFFNLSRQRARGVDLDVRYDTDTWYWGMAAQRTTEFKQATFEEDPLESVLGIRAGDYSRPEWISNTWFGYTWADWTGEIMFRYKSSVEDSTTDPDDNVAFIPALKEFDAFIRYDGLKNMSVTFGCTNCSNEPPPFTYDEFEGYAVGYSDPRGAFWYLRLKYDLGSAMRARAR